MDRKFITGFAVGVYSMLVASTIMYEHMKLKLETQTQLAMVSKEVADINKKAVQAFVERCDIEISKEVVRLMEFDSVVLGFDHLTAQGPDLPPQEEK